MSHNVRSTGEARRGRGHSDRVHDLLKQVTDRNSFFQFVEALIDDWEDEKAKERIQPRRPYGPGANGWENGSIGNYLGAALRWARDTNMGGRQGLPEGPSWKTFAIFLYCGKVYE